MQRFVLEAKEQQKTVIYFESISAYLLFVYELQGQISDGAWENSRPASHWKWVTNLDYELTDDDAGYNGPKHSVRYDCKWMIEYLNKWLKNKDDDYQWCVRFLNFCRVGKIIDKNDLKKYTDGADSDAFESIISKLPEEEVNQEGLENSLNDYYKEKYWPKVKSEINDDFLKKFYSTEYTMKDFKDDLRSVQESMNNKL